MNDSGASRFRIRTPRGEELPVGSVEELSRRVEGGEVGPETPLFDSGTGAWGRAGDVPIFQFIVEELRAEGRLPGEEDYEDPDLVLPPDADEAVPLEVAEGFEPIRHLEEGEDPPPAPLAPPTVDPFEMHLPLGEPDPWPPLSPSSTSPAEEEADVAPEGAESSSSEAASEQAVPDVETPELGDRGSPEPGDAGAAAEEAPLEPWFEDRPYQAPTERPSGQAEGGREGDDPADDAPGDADAPAADWITRGPPAPVAKELPPEAPAPRDAPRDAPVESEREPSAPTRRKERDGTVTPDLDTLAERRAEPRSGRKGGDPWETSRPQTLFVPRGEEKGEDAPAGPRSTPAEEPLDIRTAWEDQADDVDPRALRLQARRRRRNLQLLAAFGALAVLLMGGRVLFEAFRGPAPLPPATAPLLPDAAADPPDVDAPGVPSPAPGPGTWPAGLEEEAQALWEGLPAHLALRVEALREEAGLTEAPPREWLGGYYLANADEFETVPAFWRSYASFVASIRARDLTLVLEAAGDWLDQAQVEGTPRERLLGMVRARHAEVSAARDDRYLHLGRTAEAALAFHEFLVLNTQAIRFAPALGDGVSADPVLEAVTETPAVRRELEAHLDRIFGALDRTRAGGQPSTAGLRAELFGGFGYPL